MGNPVARALDRFLGRGEASIAVPAMDGALKPNDRVDTGSRLLAIEQPDNLLRSGASFYFSSGRRLLAVDDGDWAQPRTALECRGEILATAPAPDGRVAVFDAEQGLALLDPHSGSCQRPASGALPLQGVTAATFRDERTLLVCVGSARNSAANWQRDLLDSENAGSVWTLDLERGHAAPVAERLAYPAGCLLLPDARTLLVSESWKSRLLRIDLAGDARPQPVLTGLPGYPSRLVARPGGGAWLCVFAPRSQLIEFVRREPRYRRAMMAEVPQEFWVAPALASGTSFREPMQGGALKQMGILKPWAPTRSYGLVVALDAQWVPTASYHSRTGGRRHGITSAAALDGGLVVACRGGNELVALADGGPADVG